jgi:mono/diheme cytochrome c family protein
VTAVTERLAGARTVEPMKYARLLLIGGAMIAVVDSASAHVLLDDPNGGELLPAGADYTVEWHVHIQHNTIGWDLEYSTDGGGSWKSIAPGLPAGDITEGAIHTYDWNVPDDASTSVRVRVKQDNTGQDYYDTSDANLEIEPLEGATIYDAFCAECHGTNGDPCTSPAGCGDADPPPDWSQGESLIDANGNSISGENEDLYLVSKFGAVPYGGSEVMEADHVEITYLPEPSATLGLAAGAIGLLGLNATRRRGTR